MDNGKRLSGSCLCGAVRITAKPAGNDIGACHCGMCFKWNGGPQFAVRCGDVEVDGMDAVTVYASSEWAERGFCRRCGTHLFYRLKHGGYMVPVGMFDDPNEWNFASQIFIDRKPAFYSFAEKTTNLTGDEVFAKLGAK